MTTIIHAPSGDDDVISFGGAEGIYSRFLSVNEVHTGDGVKVELCAPGVRLMMTPAAADKLRLWLNQWVKTAVGEWWE